MSSRVVDTAAALCSALLAHPLLRNLRPAHLSLLLGCAEAEDHGAGEEICRRGEIGQDLLLVHRGRIEIVEDGRTFRILDAGESLGWFCFLTDARWACSARTAGEVTLLRLLGPCVRRKCRADPVLGYELTLRVLEELRKGTEAPFPSP